jgi:hypothetical protein
MSKAFAALLARRFAPLDFSTVPGFPHPVPSIDIWGDHLPRFAEKKEDNPSDHLIRFHQCMIQLDVYHEDVLMKMFVFSLEGDAREWYRSLPPSSISSLNEFHRVFHHRCERYFAQEILLEGCCEKFHSHTQNVYSSSGEHEILSIVAVQEEDQEIVHSPMKNKGVVDSLVFDEEQYCHPETSAVDIEAPATDIEKSSTEINMFACTILESRSADNKKPFIINNAVSLQPCSNLHAVECGSYSRKKGMQRSSDVQSKQQEEVFPYSVIDPFADYLEFSNNINVKLLLSNEGWFCCPFKLHFCMLWFLIFFESRSSMISVDQFLTWLHWKFSFT